MTAARRWTKEERQLLKDHYLAGRSVEWIAAEFATTRGNVQVILHRMGVTRGPPRGSAPRRPLRVEDIASRLAVLLGQQPRPEAPRRAFSDEELLRYAGRGNAPAVLEALRARFWPWAASLNRLDPDPAAMERLAGLGAYCSEVVGLELMDHQLAMAYLCLASKRAVCLAGRQSGKDVTIAALALWESLVAPNSRVVMVSGAQRQSDALMEKILAFVARSKETFDSVASSSREELRFRNGSFVKALPATGLIRGETATRVLVNEARDILNEEETYAAVEPMLLTTAGSLAIFTTPLAKSGRVWDAFNSPLYLKAQIPSTASRYATAEHLDRQRLEMSAARFANEYEAQFLDIQAAYFSAESIARCVRDYGFAEHAEEGKAYAVGIDWARTRDTSAIVVVSQDSDGRLRVEFVKEFLGTPLPDQVHYVRSLHATFRFRRIVSEWAGLGIGPTDELQKNGLPVDAFKPTVEAKSLGYDHLKLRLERGELTLPAHPKLLAELRILEFRFTERGAMTIHGPSDDLADATMMACWPFQARGGKPGPALVPTLSWAREFAPSGVPRSRPRLPRPQPGPVCEACGKEIEPGQEYLGADARVHARCPSSTPLPGSSENGSPESGP